MSDPGWETVREAFERDGPCLRDIYIFDATPQDWQRTLDFVRHSCADLAFTVNGQPTMLPPTAIEVLDQARTANKWMPLLRCRAGEIGIAWPFFTPIDVEFHFRPQEVHGTGPLADLYTFLKGLARSTGRPVRVTIEGLRDETILRCDPDTLALTYTRPSTLDVRGMWTKESGWIW